MDISNGGTLAASGSDDYYFEGFDPDYATEGRISLDSIAAANDDARFYPENGMRIPLDIYFHDNDNGTWEGNVGFSHLATDQQWNNPGEWAYTWIGDQSTVAGIDDGQLVAEDFELYPNYPNPFNPVTNISFSLPKDQNVKLNIFNMNGQLVNTLINEKRSAGKHTIHWNAGNSASGVYLYQLQVGDRSFTHKMILLK